MKERFRKQLEQLGGVRFEDCVVFEKLPSKAVVAGIQGDEGPFIAGPQEAREVAERYLPGSAVAESGTLTIGDENCDIHRLEASPRIRGLEQKIPEGADAVRRRAEWFRRRRGPGTGDQSNES